MNVKTAYLAFCLLGTIVPYWPFVPWLFENGPDGPLFLRELFANRISAFFGLDVIISALALLVFIRVESVRLGIRRRWLPVAAVLTVGVSLALPLFLYLRELELERRKLLAR
jgi:Terpene cyclase DEP1